MRPLGAACVQPAALDNHFTTFSSEVGFTILYSYIVYSSCSEFSNFSLERDDLSSLL